MNLTQERIAAVLGDRTDVIESLAAVESAARRSVDRRLLALCESRIATLLGLESQGVDRASLDDVERACVDFAEHWVIDVASMPDDLAGGVVDALGPSGAMDFAHALLAVEQRLRLAITWRNLELGA